MEDSVLTTAKIFGYDHQLTQRHFHELSALVSLDTIRSAGFFRLTKNYLAMLNLMIYFVLHVQKKLTLSNYEQHVRKKLSPLYINNKMRVRIHYFGQVLSYGLKMDLAEVIHILFYLIYGRFASMAYVNAMTKTQDKEKYPHNIVMVKTNSIPSEGPMSPKPEKRISWNIKGNEFEKDMLDQELTETLRLRRVRQRPTEVDEEVYISIASNKKSSSPVIQPNQLEIRLSRIKNRQTSPIMNFLREQNITNFDRLRLNRRMLSYSNDSMSKTFNVEVRKEKASQPVVYKLTRYKISLKAVLYIKQKLKSQNAFLDELRNNLMAESQNKLQRRKQHQPFEEARYYKYRKPLYYIKNVDVHRSVSEKSTMSMAVKSENRTISTESVEPPPLTTASPSEPTPKETEALPTYYGLTSQSGHYVYYSYRVTGRGKKSQFKLKLSFYKAKYKEFLAQQQNRYYMLY